MDETLISTVECANDMHGDAVFWNRYNRVYQCHRCGEVVAEPQPPPCRPTVVCLCGSTRFKREFIEANYRETMAGRIVLTVGWFSHADSEAYYPTDEEKARLDTLHLAKVHLADEVLVVNVGGYVGESTAREVAYARSLGKHVRWLEIPGG